MLKQPMKRWKHWARIQPPSGGWCVETKSKSTVWVGMSQPPSGGWCVETIAY
ncbi:hypothetical protein NEIFLAOT_01414 [Neisseria flavescens NRL30031/H210]|uniref:Uncharacterized protein n=1 Tax=Neisseria flavescens NRL30031/H210 TaxID=546264 RepID=C0EN81_NEIFL|nr:hypothetical protein NEIFLAOT_01414 [Neisseria flavescens NRL30031/H210]